MNDVQETGKKYLSRFLLVVVFVVMAGSAVEAFAQSVKVSSAGKGKVRIKRGKLFSVIDLKRDLSGCTVVFDGSDPEQQKIDITRFYLVDSVSKGDSTYIVLLASAGGNCNIQGECGATEDLTLVWLKLDRRLRPVSRNVAVIESCRYHRIDLITQIEDGDKPYKLVNASLKVEYSENPYMKPQGYNFYTLTYKRAEAEKGFVMSVKIVKQ